MTGIEAHADVLRTHVGWAQLSADIVRHHVDGSGDRLCAQRGVSEFEYGGAKNAAPSVPAVLRAPEAR